MDERLAYIRVGVPGETSEPGFHGVYRLSDGREAGPIDYPLDGRTFSSAPRWLVSVIAIVAVR